MTSHPNTTFVRHHLDRISSALLALEIEMTNYRFTDENAEEVESLAERLIALTKPNKGHLLEGVEAKEFRDAA